MSNNFSNLDNLETTIRKSSVIQERMNLVSTHMYKQFIEYQNAVLNTNEMFIKMIEHVHLTVDYLKQSFASRGISSQKVYYEIDKNKTTVKLNILWHAISFTVRSNDKPQALFREGKEPLFSGRIIAVKGNISKMRKNGEFDPDFQLILENEVASLFVPAEKQERAIIKIRHIGNREFPLNQTDAHREFLLKVIEIICGGGVYHEEYFKRNLKL